jgi:signal transduction histidine kinase
MTGSFAVLTDVTELKRAEKEKRRLELQLEQTKKMEAVGTLAGGLAHDFNNILMAIMGNISLAQMHTNRNDKVFKFLDETEKALMRGRDLTQKFIIFSKGGELERKVTAISDLIKSTTKLSLGGSNIEFEFSFPDDLWQVEIDKIQMRQVMSILIANTKDAQPEGGVVRIWAENITIEKENMGAGLPRNKGNYVKVAIQDMGAGISEENLPRIFDPYFSTKKNWTQKGMGLGLATVYAIILRHDGNIHVESEEGIGTTVHIYLHVFE